MKKTFNTSQRDKKPSSASKPDSSGKEKPNRPGGGSYDPVKPRGPERKEKFPEKEPSK